MNKRAVEVSKIQDWLCERFAPKTKTVRNNKRWKDIQYALYRAYEAGQDDNTRTDK